MKFFHTWQLLFFLVFISISATASDTAQQLYAQHQQSIYRIDVLSSASEQKAGLGTGFVVVAPDILATNYHVVSNAILEPENYHLEWVGLHNRRGPLVILAVDVIHDLALLKADIALGSPLQTTHIPPKGAALFAFGHPLGLDIAVVNGSANGLMENALYDKIHFSGNINPGMSGGPTLDSRGRVVGVNVATAGDGVGFLVPAHYLDILIEKTRSMNFEAGQDLHAMIGEQLLSNQQKLFDKLLASTWHTQKIGKMSVPAALNSQLDCWGDTEEATKKKPYREIQSNCSGQDNIFLSDRQRAGEIYYQYFWLESEAISPRAFYKMFNDHHNSEFQSDASEKDVGNFVCSVHFVEISGQSFKMNVCSRPYKRYEELNDFMVLAAMTGHPQQGLMFTMDLSAVTLDNGMRLLEAMLKGFIWQP